MKVLIAYDRRLFGNHFDRFKSVITENFPNRWHCFDSAYIVKTELTVEEVRKLLFTALDPNDSVLIHELGQEWRAIGVSAQQGWLEAD